MELNKVYYTIGEVAAKFGVSNSLLRYWESEFESIKPSKNKRGDRRYAEKDIEAVSEVFNLLKGKGYTIEGARKELKGIVRATPVKNDNLLREKLYQIRSRLNDLEKQL